MTRNIAFRPLTEDEGGGYLVEFPDLPGCIATGKTRKQVERLMREAIQFHIAGMKARGQKVPEPTIEAGTVSVGT